MALMEVNFFSKALMRPVTMNVILPADKVFFGEETEEENKPFKTLYLLHGVMGNYTDWVTGTCIKRWAEEKNLAVVMPSGANMFYMDHPNANENYSEFIGKELVKITRRMFPLSYKKEDTFIAGLSMGGYGAIRNGLKYHDTFGYIAGLSSAMILEKMGTADDSSPMFFEKKSFLESVFGDLSRIKDCEINPEWIAENMKKDGIPFPHMYLACGLDDPLLPPNRKFRDTMQKLGVDVTYEEGPGAHEWDFWNRYIKKVLDWLPLDKDSKEGLNSGNVGLIVGPWAGPAGPPHGENRPARPFCRRCAPGLNWPGRASGAVTLKKLECSKQAIALDTLAWDNIIGFRSYCVGLRDRSND